MSILGELTPRAAVLACMAAITLALAASLFVAPANPAANRRLGLALVVLGGVGLAYTIELSRLDRAADWLRWAPISVPLAFGPLLYAYVFRLTTGHDPPLAPLHYLPAAVQAVYLVGFYLLPGDLQAVLGDGRGKDRVRPLLDWALLLSLAGYALAGLRSLARYRGWVVQTRSDADVWAARWIRNLLLVLLALLVAQTAIRAHTWLIGGLDVFDVYAFHLWLGAVGVYLGVEGRRYSDRPFPHRSVAQPEPAAPPPRDWTAIGEQWRERTREAGWWREPGLTLADLARRLGTNTSHLSRAVNEGLGQNLAEMINRMRADEVARLLDGPEGRGRDLLDIAFEAGFSSKASFNRAFRAAHGVTPSEYRASRRVKS